MEVTIFGDDGEKIMQMPASDFLNKYSNASAHNIPTTSSADAKIAEILETSQPNTPPLIPSLKEDEACTISKQSVHARVIMAAKLIIWDEASMAHRKSVEAVDSLLRDLMENNLPFGAT
ncbi:hypothetical protein OROHE_017001 [Orobanche hederae]